MAQDRKTRGALRSAKAGRSGSSRQGAQATPRKPSPRPGKSPGKATTTNGRDWLSVMSQGHPEERPRSSARH